MSEESTFAEYYEYYLTLHQNNVNRGLHITGQCVTLSLLVYALATQTWPLLLLVPLVVYPFAWVGHLVFEKNQPAAWTNPLWAKACDWVMLKDILTGKLK
jgi:hypothetical protein